MHRAATGDRAVSAWESFGIRAVAFAGAVALFGEIFGESLGKRGDWSALFRHVAQGLPRSDAAPPFPWWLLSQVPPSCGRRRVWRDGASLLGGLVDRVAALSSTGQPLVRAANGLDLLVFRKEESEMTGRPPLRAVWERCRYGSHARAFGRRQAL